MILEDEFEICIKNLDHGFNIKIVSLKYRNSHFKDNMILQSSLPQWKFLYW